MKISQKIITYLKKSGVDFYLSVPCKLLANMIEILEKDKDVFYSAVPREEEGLGICAGAYLGNKLPCIMMQNTGIGNSVNAIVSLLQLYQMPVVFLISYRGTPGEPVGAQGGMAKVTEDILNTLRIPTLCCSSEEDLEKIISFTKHAKIVESPVAILCDFNLMKDDK
jgi:sulfopyruvate decarboxylase, alpha subunit